MKKRLPNPIVLQTILEHLNWSGDKMEFNFFVGEDKHTATLHLVDLYKIIKWK